MGSAGWRRFCGQLSGRFVVPTGRTLFYFGTRHFVPGYLRIVPSGQRPLTPVHEFDARSRQTEHRPFEDEDDDEDDDEDE
jgi:hypothetical protein